MPGLTFDEACKIILDDPKADPYAQAYAKRGIGMTGQARRVQALYILSNLERWRSPHGKEVRKVLQEYTK